MIKLDKKKLGVDIYLHGVKICFSIKSIVTENILAAGMGTSASADFVRAKVVICMAEFGERTSFRWASRMTRR